MLKQRFLLLYTHGTEDECVYELGFQLGVFIINKQSSPRNLKQLLKCCEIIGCCS